MLNVDIHEATDASSKAWFGICGLGRRGRLRDAGSRHAMVTNGSGATNVTAVNPVNTITSAWTMTVGTQTVNGKGILDQNCKHN